MPRTARLSGQLPSPPKSSEGSLSSRSSCETVPNNRRRCNREKRLTPPHDKKSRVLRRQSVQNVAGELRAFFAISSLPTGKEKRDLLLSAVDRVSALYDGPSRGRGRAKRLSLDDSVNPIRQTGRDPSNNDGIVLQKHWLTSGLYVGSRASAGNSKILSRGRKSDPGSGTARKFKFTLPIYHGQLLMDQRRDFKLPWNLYATTGQKCKPPNWSRIRRNVHVDVDPYDKKAHRPECLCRVECDEACLNRAMFYECDHQNCALKNPADCSNRTFQQAAIRYADHKAKSCGFEVFDTEDRGFGLRALRDFQPNAFILEYLGEVISTEECEDRMVSMYAGRNNYYFLNIDAYTVLDAGRKGSEARFANHSCSPNARIEKWIVRGEPRIGVFAGKNGIEAGQEITYDYNFSWFEGAKEQKCKCGAINCRGFIGKRKATTLLKPETAKEGKKTATKVKRVVQGRVTKLSRKKVKPTIKNAKVANTTVIASRTKAKAMGKRKVRRTVKMVKSTASLKRGASLGKHAQSDSSFQSRRKIPKSSKNVIAKRNIAKPRRKAMVKSPDPTCTRPIYETVRHRSCKRHVR